MNIILVAIISLSVIGLCCAAVITIASKIMFVKVDVRVEKVRNCLPGANCGACGFSGCDGYAEALVRGEVASNLCPPGGDKTYEQINEILGLTGDGLAKMTARVHCLGDSDTMHTKMEYVGIDTCFAAKQLHGGQGACTYGCIGFGDCVKVCPSNAICIEKGLARIDPRRCSGCAVCVKVCPTGVISVYPEPVRVTVMCKNTEKGAKTKEKCSRGCIGCTRCVRECPAKVISMDESLAIIDYSMCDGCRKCIEVCPPKCIV